MRYHGGKWRIAPWIISHFPPHRTYVEPYGGAASVLMRKDRSIAEVYNDLDDDVVNVFRVLRDPDLSAKLHQACYYTPWSRTEFFGSYELAEDPVERARRTILRSFMAHGSTHRRAHHTGFRSKSWVQRRPASNEWINYPDQIVFYTERMRGVVIENRNALEVIKQHDHPDTLFYVDPPYVLNTRSSVRNQGEKRGKRGYIHNLSDDEHRELLEVLLQCSGMVILSGYKSEIYQDHLFGWEVRTKKTMADNGKHREECLWLSPNVTKRGAELQFGEEPA